MTIDADLFDYVTGDATVAGLIGDRMYPVVLPQKGTLPALRYLFVSDVPGQTQTGTDGLFRARVQVDCYARRRSEARALAGAVLARLNGLRGTMGGSSVGALQAVGQVEMFEESVELFRVMLDFLILYRE